MIKNFIRKRTTAISRLLAKEKIDCLIVTKPANVTYLTGFLGTDSWAAITRQGRAYLLTDSRYMEQAQAECRDCRIVQRANFVPLAQAAAELVDKLKSVQTVAVENSTSVADFHALRRKVEARLKTAEGIIESSRRIKDGSEIAAIRKAASIAAKALKQTVRRINPGISESELAGMLDFEVRKLGATTGFETIVAFGPNASRPHHQPTTRKLKTTDTILIDFGAKHQGYCCDITRCFAVGRPAALYKKAYEVVERAQAAAIRTVKAGAELVQVDAAAREVIRKNDLPVYTHGTGHGFGLEIHELPFVKVQGQGKLQAGEVLTIEPGIYLPGKVGVRIEDDVLVTETGCKILTSRCPHSPLFFDGPA
jgi:Xaa-Pro aminopeptidase